jgi:uncharacterized protein involved in exopolysaccharide biosynthesis
MAYAGAEMGIREYVRVLARRERLVFAVVGLFVVVALSYSSLAYKIYASSADVLIVTNP